MPLPKRRLSQTACVLSLLAPLLSVHAQSTSETNPTLNLLLKKGLISQQEYAQVLTENHQLDASRRDEHKSLFNVDPIMKRFTFIGRLQTQYVYSGYQQAGTNSGISNTTNEIYWRRAYIGFKADLADGFSTTFVPNFAGSTWGGSRSMDRAFISYENPRWGNVDVGYRKVQWGVEENTSSGNLLTVERSATNRFWGEAGGPPGDPQSNTGFGARHTGLFYSKQWGLNDRNRLEYNMSLVNPQQGWNTSKINVFGFYTSLAYTLKLAQHVIHTFGLNYGNTQPYTSTATCSIVSCGPNANMGQMQGLNPYLKLQFDKLIFQAEYLATQIQAGNSQNTPYNSSGTHTPFGYTFIGAYEFMPKWQVALRYSDLNTDGYGTTMSQMIQEGVSTLTTTTYNTVQSYYAGLNYYIKHENIKLQVGYERLEFSGLVASYGTIPPTTNGSGSASADVVRAQVQLQW